MHVHTRRQVTVRTVPGTARPGDRGVVLGGGLIVSGTLVLAFA
jgi:hypothetical protein